MIIMKKLDDLHPWQSDWKTQSRNYLSESKAKFQLEFLNYKLLHKISEIYFYSFS